MTRIKRFFTATVMFVTVLSMSVIVAPKADAASAGDLIKMNGLSSVYYLAGDGKRYVFPNEQTFFSWYGDFSSVVTISQSELEAIPLGKNVAIRPGTKLVKITTDPKVYAVEPGGVLVWVSSEAAAKALWGDDWAKKVVDVPDAFFTNYTIASGRQVSETAYPAGSLVKFGTSPDVYYVNADGTASKIASEAAFLANRFNWNNVITSTLTVPTLGDEITGAVATITDTSAGAGGTIGAGTGLTVAISSDTLASTNVPSYASLVPFVTVNLTASQDGPVTVSDLTFTRFGTGATTDFSGGYLYSGDTRLTDKKSIDSSSHKITFGALNLTIPAGSTKQVVLKMNAKTSATVSGSHAFKVNAASDIITNGASVSGSFPVAGNMMSYSASASAATITLTASGNEVNRNVGESNVVLGEFNINNSTANEDVYIYRVKVRNDGDATNGSIGSLSLDLDGTKVAENVSLTDRYVDFVLATPFLLKKSKQITGTIRGNVLTDVNKTIQLFLNKEVDFEARGTAYGSFYSAMVTNTSFDGDGVGVQADIVTIKGSKINISFDGPAAAEVKKNTTNVVFAKMLIKAESEDVNVENLRLQLVTSAASSTATLNNVKMVDNGNNASYTVEDPAGGATTENLNFENVYLKKGVQYTFEVRGDIPDAAGMTGFTYRVDFTTTGTTGRFVGSDTAFTAATDFSTTGLTGKLFTVAAPSIKFDIVPTNAATYVKNAKGVLLYNGKITASVDNQKVSRIKFNVSTTTSMALDRVYLYKSENGTETLLDDETSLGSTSFTFSGFTLDVPKGVASTVKYVVRGDVKSQPTVTTDTWTVSCSNTGTDHTVRDSDNNAVDTINFGTSMTGPAISIVTLGTYTIAVDNTESGTNADKYGLAGTTVTVGRFKVTAAKEAATLKQLAVYNNGSATDTSVGTLKLYKGSVATENLVSTAGLSATKFALFENINAEIPTSGSTYFYVTAALKNVDYSTSPSAGATGVATSTVYFAATSTGSTMITKVEGKMTGELETNADMTGATSMKTTTLMPAMMSNITSSFANDSLTVGANDIFSFKVTAPSTGATENIDVNQENLGFKLATTTFKIATSGPFVLSAFKIKRVGGGDGQITLTDGTDYTYNSGTGALVIGFQNAYGTKQDLIVRPGVTAEYIIEASVAGLTSTNSLRTSIETINTNVKYFFDAGSVPSIEFAPNITGIENVRGGSLTN